MYFDRAKRPDWLCVLRVLGNYQWLDNRQGLEQFRSYMNKRTQEILYSESPGIFDKNWQDIRRGWCLGDDTFRAEMEGLVEARIDQYDRRSYLGDEARKHDEREAERLLVAGLDVLGVEIDQLPAMQKSDPRKKVLAWLIRRNTSIKNDWICERLSMGHASNLARHVKDVEQSANEDVIKMREMTRKAF